MYIHSGSGCGGGWGEGVYSVEPQVSLFGHERRDRCNVMLLLCNISCDDGCQLSTRYEMTVFIRIVLLTCKSKRDTTLSCHIVWCQRIYSLQTWIILMARWENLHVYHVFWYYEHHRLSTGVYWEMAENSNNNEFTVDYLIIITRPKTKAETYVYVIVNNALP